MKEEFDLKDFMVSILRKWKKMLFCGILFAILFGGMKYVKGMHEYKNNDSQENTEDVKQKKIQKNLSENIKTLNEGIHNWDEYYVNSKLMKIDTYNAKRYVLTFVIDGNDEKTMLGANGLASACKNVICNEEYYRFSEEISGISAEDLNDLVLVYANENSVEIIGYQYDNEDMESAVEAIFKKLENTFSEGTFGNYNVRKISAGYMTGKDDKLTSLKDSVISNGEKYITERESRKRVLQAYQEETGVEVISKSDVIADGVKFAVIGFVAGIIFAVFFGLFCDMMSTKLKDERELERGLDLFCLGRSELLNKKKNAIDHAIDALEGKKGKGLDKEKWKQYVCAMIRKQTSDQKIMLITSLPDKLVETAAKEIKQCLEQDSTKCEYYGSILAASDGVNAVVPGSEVVLIERLNESNLNDIQKECQIIEKFGAKVIGFVMV